MSITKYKDTIENGDLIMVYISRLHIKPIVVQQGEVLNTRFGSFPHDSMIGLKYGAQLLTPKGKGFVYLLHPTPELWTVSLPHRTQIVYTPDSSYILQRMNVIGGSRVIEAGTGSGSFTHAFARNVGQSGRIFTYEFHEARYKQAVQEFGDHGLNDMVVVTHRDVCSQGFVITQEKIDADSVFLDLPSPWDAIPHLDEVISQKRQVDICCFSPCVEQVMKTVESLHENGWTQVEMTEVSSLVWESRKEMIREVDDALKRLKDVKKRQKEGIEKLKELAKAKAKAKAEMKSDTYIKQPKLKDRDRGYNPFGKGRRIAEGEEGFDWFNVSKTEREIKSHTSYLTFAVKVPQLQL
ncbi:hypothetical protein FOA43_004239 [Brettanomyces nanus]|uniref:tRNA (adenine(58)-N(1))-methyltransferase catalytic subunit TRM61 n=1 Tax=Eeniella nana TaxID=13502 RepID=A0A875S9N6_EENNA|nr:uncharacterized protein FOA43_004239 [Brettanomyces nanus]QPG76845.1 hypothetical protein FOA43_004239 [Brettanomyces nanus]